MKNLSVIIRGGGDLASGIAHRLFKSGFRPILTELRQPHTVRRTVSFSSAVFEGEYTVEGVKAIAEQKPFSRGRDYIPVVIADEYLIQNPDILIDARMMKELRTDPFPPARLRIGLGPGFTAGEDCDKVIETNRGIYLGKVIEKGKAQSDTKIPGIIAGKGIERVLRAPEEGIVTHYASIGDLLEEGQKVMSVSSKTKEFFITAPFKGRLRGLIGESLYVYREEKIGDIDPRENIDCFAISDKARAVGGGVLEAIMSSFDWLVKI